MNYISITLISVSTIIMFICCLKSYKLNRDFQLNKAYVFLSKINFPITLIFLLSYFVLDILFFLNSKINNLILIPTLLFSSSIYTFISIYIQSSMHLVINQANLDTIRCLVNSIEARDFYTKGHSEHVSNLVSVLYSHLPKAYKKKINLTHLKTAGLLHDIGKLGVSENILNKNGKLSETEWKSMKKHPSIGKKILDSSEHLDIVSHWIYYHHERVDGNGYYNVANEGIPLASKILAIADTYSALVTARPYRDAMCHEDAINILRDAAGTQLDAYLVGIFCYINKNLIINCNPEVNSIYNIL